MNWYEDDVKTLEKKRDEFGYAPETIFYGSSSIRLWTTLDSDFEQYKPINLGFGGSTLAACVWFFDRIMEHLQPKRLIVYAGDNDLGDGRHGEEVYIFFQQLVERVKTRYGNLPLAYISIKPSIVRWGINDQIKYTNSLIEAEVKKNSNQVFIDTYSQMTDASGYPNRSLYVPDGLHLSESGYTLWKTSVIDYLQTQQN